MNKNPFTAYWPLISLVLIAVLAALAFTHGIGGSGFQWMHYFMGIVLCQFAMLKIFHPAGFAEGFQMYDLLAMRAPLYAHAYPFIELALGLAYLGFLFPLFTYIATIAITFIGAVGVITALKKGLDLRCACMGTVLNVPLSTVTLTEDIGMGVMALILLLRSI